MSVYLNAFSKSTAKRPEIHYGNRLLTAYFREVARLEIPTALQEHDLFTQYKYEQDPKKKRELKGQIAKGYLRFVIKRALHKTRDESLLLDLINAGNEGLLVAIDKFEIDKGHRFLTYGAWWIRVHIQTALKEAGLGRLNTPPPETEETVQSSQPAVQYLANPTFLPSNEPSAESLLGTAKFNILHELRLAELSRRETLILIYYYGLRGGYKLTFSQLARLLCELDGRYISAEHVRQLKERAVSQLRDVLVSAELNCSGDVI